MKDLRIFDGHCDTAVRIFQHRQPLLQNDGHVSLEKAKPLGAWAQFFAFCTCDGFSQGQPHEQFLQAMRYFREQSASNANRIAICKSARDAETALADGKCAAFLSVEGAEAVKCDLSLLEDAYEMGVRMIAPTWNNANELSGSCVTGEGLTEKGKDFCKRAQRLGMIVDVSHLSERGFWDLCDLAEKPIAASHSNARAVCDHVRNLTDDQFRAICDLGGTAGINLYEPFLTEGKATLDDVYRHIDHFASLGGIEHVAIGADLDGCELLPQGFADVGSYKVLAQYLQDRGYTDADLSQLFFDSLWEVLTKCNI
ncbi:MAG: dipeptidase [Oscillospiraceae bacterium]|nr:dipeptidase [Oscillospiraceae bacterium]